MRPWFGLHLTSYTFPETAPKDIFDRLLEQARTAEDAGFDLLTVMDHWFPLGFEVLGHKTKVLERHCAEIGRDPSTIERTMGAPVMVAANDAEKAALLEQIPEERRPYVNVGTPEQMADALQPYLDAGFSGFTFNNSIYRTPEAIGRLGELLRLVGGATPAIA